MKGRLQAEGTELREFLAQQHRVWVAAGAPRPAGWCYATVEEFLLTHGRAWPWAPRPKGIRLGAVKACFHNALQLATRRPEFAYVEGYVDRPIPLHHAWVVTAQGQVVDPTLRLEPGEVPGYFGVAFQTDWVWRVVVKQKQYGVLYPALPRWPHMEDYPPRFLRWPPSESACPAD